MCPVLSPPVMTVCVCCACLSGEAPVFRSVSLRLFVLVFVRGCVSLTVDLSMLAASGSLAFFVLSKTVPAVAWELVCIDVVLQCAAPPRASPCDWGRGQQRPSCDGAGGRGRTLLTKKKVLALQGDRAQQENVPTTRQQRRQR